MRVKVASALASTTRYPFHAANGNLLFEYDPPGVKDYVYLGNKLIAISPGGSGAPTYMHTDLLGSPVVATDTTGALTARENYQPWGQQLLLGGAAGNTLWFTGKSHDWDSKLSYFGARYYDVTLGRFMGVDPQDFDEANLHGFNRYAYGNNNPYKFKDPNGEVAETILDVVSLGLSIAAFKSDPTLLNGLALAYDAVAAATPFLPGGVGILRQAGKAAEGLGDAARGGAQILQSAGAAVNRHVNFGARQLQSKFGHAADFGVTGPWNRAAGEAFQRALQAHVGDAATLVIKGTYRGQEVTHFLNPTTGLNVMRGADDAFISGWRLNPAQLENVLTRGSL
jgi:RHS repeat-associated protein